MDEFNGLYPLVHDIIGTTYAADPFGYVATCFVLLWIIYSIFNLIFYAFGIKKK